MARDSLFGETILWSGRPRVIKTPRPYLLIAGTSAVLSAVGLCFAVIVATGLHASPSGLLAFSGWCAALAFGAWRLPLVWQSGVEYIVTEKHVIWRRGRIRRSIDRGAISYALMTWDSKLSDVGDLVLVRAVPTGALRRTLSLSLTGVTGPDRLWAIVRGMTAPAPFGHGELPLAQRLDPGERVLWSGIPLASPWTVRRAITAAFAALLGVAAARTVLQAIPTLRRVLRLHTLPPVSVAILITGVALAALLLVAVAMGVAYMACLRPRLLSRATRYFVTDKRVLIRRGQEELHLDRSRIAYVISAAAGARRLHDIFLVLDGPQARALAPSGAFAANRDADALLPVFASIEDAETVGAILGHDDVEAPLPRAA
jgi:hypothetical protein